MANMRRQSFKSSSIRGEWYQNFLWGAVARLGLARAYRLEAQSKQGADAENAPSEARVAHQEFHSLKEAKAEYAKLK
jgi:hypothetical protein